MAAPTLQDAIDQAGSPVKLVWRPQAESWTVPVVEPEYVGWAEEQSAWREAVSLSDLSHHMSDLFIEGPDATRLLREHSANDFEAFAIGQAKQFVPVTAEGLLVTDGILMREGENEYTLSGVPAAQNWIKYHGETGRYDVAFTLDPDSRIRGDEKPTLFRYQIQGVHALDLVAEVFGGPLPKTKFFHTTPVSLGGRHFRALRHGMAGQPGYEFIGEWADADFVKEAFLRAGESFGLVQVGGKAYYTNGIESGWIPTPTPAIFTDPNLEGYRRWISAFSYEGKKPLHGSFFSENIEDYYVSPFELGYGRSISFNHDFLGREALERSRDSVRRTKVTLEFNAEDVRRVFGEKPGYQLSYGRYRIEAAGKLVGITFYTGHIAPIGKILALSLIQTDYAEPGTPVEVVWGEHPGPGTAPDADLGFDRIRATVQLSPYNEFARTQYRKSA